MAEIFADSKAKIITYYLPQFHTIPENDMFHGKGFTEWTNTKKATPLFEGHYQPKTPYNENYYCLLNPEVMREQATLAKKYGVYGFCYYHYWFKGGKKLLEKPVENMLADKEVGIPFCLSWANENWCKRWDGGNQEVIVEQDYGGPTDWKKHIDYLIPFFMDPRYITVHGKPLFVIYRPELMPNLTEMMRFWQNEVKKVGLEGICFAIQFPDWYFMTAYNADCFDYQIKFEPFFSHNYMVKDIVTMKRKQKLYTVMRKIGLGNVVEKLISKKKATKSASSTKPQLTIKDYDETWNEILTTPIDEKTIEGAFVDWDNTARKKNGIVYKNGSPEKFGQYLEKLIMRVHNEASNPMIFINAWNEWAEGAYLEPDMKYGYTYLEALKKALIKE